MVVAANQWPVWGPNKNNETLEIYGNYFSVFYLINSGAMYPGLQIVKIQKI